MKNNNSTKNASSSLIQTFDDPITRYSIIVISIVSGLVIIQALYDGLVPSNWPIPKFLSDADKQLVINFVEWFGVLYGFLLPQILVKVWEQFDEIDNKFDAEADAISILIGDLALLQSHDKKHSFRILSSLYAYAKNVVGFLNGEIKAEDERQNGSRILKEIRIFYFGVVHQAPETKGEADALINELLTQLNSIIDNRGDRISLSTQRLFESLNSIAIITSIVWLVPFYFLHFQNNAGKELELGIFGWLLIISVTFLVIIIMSIIEDLDKPFDGRWKVNKSSWEDLVGEIGEEIQNLKKAKPEDGNNKKKKRISSK